MPLPFASRNGSADSTPLLRRLLALSWQYRRECLAVFGYQVAARSFVDGVLIQGAIMILSLVVYVAYMARTHLPLTLACLFLTPLLWIATSVFARWARPAYAKNRGLVDDMVLTMIRHADLVLVLDHGRVVERGTHVALLAQDRRYAQMYRQFVSSVEARS